MAEPFRIVPEDETDTAPAQESSLHINALMLALSALSQRALVAVSKLFTLLTVASAFVLWWSVLPSPSIYQIVGLTIYAVFLLIVNWLVRRP